MLGREGKGREGITNLVEWVGEGQVRDISKHAKKNQPSTINLSAGAF